MSKLLLLMAALLLACPLYTKANEEYEVRGSGSSEKYAERKALEKALHKALEDKVGEDKVKENRKDLKKIIRDLVKRKSKRRKVVTSQEVIDEFDGDGMTIAVEVDVDRLLAMVADEGVNLTETTKFQGRVVISRDATRLKQEQIVDAERNILALRDRLQENLQQKFQIYDAEALWKSVRDESAQLEESAAANPTDFLMRKQNMATHITYFWGKTWFKEVLGMRYCFGEVGLRVIRVVSGEEIARFRLSADELSGKAPPSSDGKERVDRDDDHARRVALGELAKNISQKLIDKLQSEKWEQIRVDLPRVKLRAGGFTASDLAEVKKALLMMEQNGQIAFEAGSAESGSGYFGYMVTFPKKDGEQLNQISLDVYLRETCNAMGILVDAKSAPGKLYVHPRGEEPEDLTGF